MAENSAIEWTDHTFNPWIGCTKVSPACDHCYAEAQNAFRKWAPDGWGPHAARKRTSDTYWRQPRKWSRDAEDASRRPRVFCASLADVFDNHRSIDPTWRLDLFRMISETQHLDWLLLTKRPQNVAKMVPPAWMRAGFPPNVWLGTTAENQTEADRRIPPLLSIPARVRFLSCEPLLGPLHLVQPQFGAFHCAAYCQRTCAAGGDEECPKHIAPMIDWIIAGGESGHHARPSNPQWFRDLRDQCAAAGTPFLFKQWGEWVSVSEVEGPGQHHRFEDGRTVRRTGKKRAGRTLDGVLHDGFPAMEGNNA